MRLSPPIRGRLAPFYLQISLIGSSVHARRKQAQPHSLKMEVSNTE